MACRVFNFFSISQVQMENDVNVFAKNRQYSNNGILIYLRTYKLYIFLVDRSLSWLRFLCNGEAIISPVQAAQCREDQVEQEFRPWCHSSSKATSFVWPTTGHNSRCLLQTLVVFHSGVSYHWKYLRNLATIESFRLARTYYFSALSSMFAMQ